MNMPPPHIGRVALVVSDLVRSIDFYTQVIGLALENQAGLLVRLSAGTNTLLELHEQPGARPIRRATGLYHFALLLPTRRDLAVTLRHLLQVNAPITGYADHAVSEAIYLTDPDGHGIEIYRDRPRSEWRYSNGQLRMTVDPIDLQGIMAELEGQPTGWSGLPAGTMMGHIHLQVADIPASENFYIKLLGFDLVTRYGAGASFLSANGYHHHFGLNTWAGVGLPPAPADAARLLWYEIKLQDKSALETLSDRLAASLYPFAFKENRIHVTDPAGINVRLTY